MSTITVKDVARKSGVSIATVSRVINNMDNVKPNTRMLVEEAMKELNYHPNSMAQNFVNQKTKRIALIVDVDNEDAFANPFFYQVQFGIERYLGNKGYSLSIYNISNHTKRTGLIERLVFEKQVDGIILHSMLLTKKMVQSLVKSDLPFICIGEPREKFGVNWVDVDNYQGGQLAAQHIMEMNYKKTLLITNEETDLFKVRRKAGIISVFGENSRTLIEKKLSNDIGFEDAYKLLFDFFKENEDVDSIIAINNLNALAAERAALDLGRKIPSDLGIVTFDKYPVVELSLPQLTTVDIDVLSLGDSAASILLQNIESDSKFLTNMNISVKLSVRKSTIMMP